MNKVSDSVDVLKSRIDNAISPSVKYIRYLEGEMEKRDSLIVFHNEKNARLEKEVKQLKVLIEYLNNANKQQTI